MKTFYSFIVLLAIIAGLSFGFTPENNYNNYSKVFLNTDIRNKSYSPEASTIFSQNFDGAWTIASTLSPAWSSVGTGNNEWHMNTFTTGWTSTSGAYSPTGANSTTQSARFHTYGASSGTTGDLITPNIDFSSFSNYKILSFYHINTSGTDALNIYLSTDNGVTWGNSLMTLGVSLIWSQYFINLGSITSSQVKIKFTATSDYGTTDIGIDQVLIQDGSEFAPLNGTYTIDNTLPTSGTNYASFTTAINALNTAGISATTIFNVTAGQTFNEDIPAITATGTSSNSIIFQKSGAGVDPIIKPTGTAATNDAGIKIAGGDYITFDGIDININTGSAVEYGYYIYNTSATNGAQNNTIKNSKIILNRTNTSSIGIYQNCAVTPTNQLTGNNNNNKYYNIIIENCYKGIYLLGSTASFFDSGCEIGTVSGGSTIIGASTANDIGNGATTTAGIHLSRQGGTLVYNTEIRNVTVTSGVNAYGIYIENAQGNEFKIYNNKIHDIKTTSTSTSSILYGILANVNNGYTASIFNNFIYGFSHGISTASATMVARGIAAHISATTGTVNAYYNTVRMELSAAATNTAFYSQSGTVNTINNIFSNFSIAGATSLRYCSYISSGTLNNSNNNDYYINTAGTGNNVGYYSATNINTLANWQTATGKDGGSKNSNPQFTSTTDLHIPNGTSSELESAGQVIAGYTSDIDNETRNASTPDIGADEFAGTPLDLTPPVISYTPLGNTSTTGNRTLTASISDAGSGVPTSGIGLPVLYWRINAGGYSAATGSYVSGNNYQFSFGAGAVAGDNIYYYIVAQDLAGTPNVSANPSAGAGGFSYNPPAASTPPTTPNTYMITQAPLSGDYTVGVTMFNKISGHNITFEKVVKKVMKEVYVEEPQNDKKEIITSNEKGKSGNELLAKHEDKASSEIKGRKELREVEEISWIAMENGKEYEGPLYVKKSENPSLQYPMNINGIYATITAAVADLNLRGVSGPVNFLLTDATYSSETLPISINEVVGASVTNKITIKPNTSINAIISGSSTSSIFKLNGADFIIIDGSNNGSNSKNLTITNTSTSATTASIWISSLGLGAGATNDVIKNCNVNCGSSAVINYGVTIGSLIGTSGSDNDNVTISNNAIANTSNGIYAYGSAAISNGGNDNLNILSNSITINSSLGTTYGIQAGYSLNSAINNNTLNINTNTGTPVGISIETGFLNSSVNNNLFTAVNTSATGGYGGRGITIGTGNASSSLTIANNMLYGVNGSNYSGFGNSSSMGIGIGIIGNSSTLTTTSGGINLYYNSVNMYGTYSYAAACLTASVYVGSGASALDIRDNIFVNSLNNTNASGTASKNYSIYSAATSGAFTQINYNDYFVSGTQGVLGFLSSDQTTLALWKAATTKDANSVSGDPKFLSNINLHIDPYATTPVNNAGTPIAGITTDIDGNTRNVSTPDIGADEYTYIAPSVDDPTSFAATKIHSTEIDLSWALNANNNNVIIATNTTSTFGVPVKGTPYNVNDVIAGGGTIIYNGPETAFQHTGLNYNTPYYYKAFSYTDGGFEYSNGVIANATTTLPNAPGTFSSLAVSGTQINLSWTKNASGNDIVVATNTTSTFGSPVNGTTYNANDPITGGGTVIYRGNALAFNHTGLNPATTYYYKAWSVDGGTGYSTGLTTNATTYCNAISAFPWNENFDAVTIPNFPSCWFKENGDWVTTNNSNSSYDADARSGTQFLRESYSATNEYMWSPGFQMNAGAAYDFSFWWAGDNYSGWTGDIFVNSSQISTGATQLGTSFVTSATTTTKTYAQVTRTFTPASTGTYYFAIRVNATSSPWYLSFDDFSVTQSLALPPVSLSATPISESQINVAFTPNASNQNVVISWNTSGTFTDPTGTPPAVGEAFAGGTLLYNGITSPQSHTGLTGGTKYYYKAFSYDGFGNYSSGISANATTLCQTSVPFTQDFEGATFPPLCWSLASSGTNWSRVTSASGYGTGTASAYANFYSISSGGTLDIISGDFDISSLPNPILIFDHAYATYSGENDQLQILYSTNHGINYTSLIIYDGGTSGPLNTGGITTGSFVPTASQWATKKLTLPAGTNKLKFHGISAFGNNLYLDNIQVKNQPSNEVMTVSVDVPYNNALGMPVAPTATVKNNGSATANFNVQMTITGGYTSTKTVTGLAQDASTSVTFDNWNASEGPYNVTVTTQLTGDENPANDTKTKNAIGVFPAEEFPTLGSVYPTTTYLGSGASYKDVSNTNWLFVTGGNTTSTLGTECNKYNVNTDTWSAIASLPAGRRVHTSTVVGNNLYVIGGSDMSSVYQSTVYSYDIAANSWTTVASLPVALAWGKAVTYGNYIYLAGGVDGSNNILSSVYVYDVTANTWSSATSMPGIKFGGAFSIVGNKLIYVAGADDIGISNSVYIGTINAGNPLLVSWTTALNKYPGMNNGLNYSGKGNLFEQKIPDTKKKEINKEHKNGKDKIDDSIGKINISDNKKDKSKSDNKSNKNEYNEKFSPNAASYPAGAMYRFDAAKWGSNEIIVTSGSPSSDWAPANPGPTYSYNPQTDTWTLHPYIITTPVTGTAIGSFETATGLKLVLASGLAAGAPTNLTQIYTKVLPVLNITAMVEGFCNGTTMVSDSIVVELRNSSSYEIVDSKKITLSNTGTSSALFSLAKNSTLYWIVIKHRNSIETWSATPQQFTSSALNYDFTTAANKAYGDNLVLVGTKYCLYSGDVNGDGAIDIRDISPVFNDIENFTTGYVFTDLTGDENVDVRDYTIVFNNSDSFIGAIKPPGAMDNKQLEQLQKRTQNRNSVQHNSNSINKKDF